MVRKEFAEILMRLSTFPVELTLTTNGILADKYLDALKTAGINSINVSLDTLNRKTFRKLTKRDQFDQIWTNILLLLNHDFRVKITEKLPLHVRFIEFMPFQGNFWSSNQVVTTNQMLDLAQREFDIVS